MCHVGRGKLVSSAIIEYYYFTSTDHLISDVVGSIQTADVAATLGPRFVYRDRAGSAGAIHDARLGEDNIPCLKEDSLIYMIWSLRLEQK